MSGGVAGVRGQPRPLCRSVVRLKRIHEEENSSITNRPARCTYPEKKSVLTSGATPVGRINDIDAPAEAAVTVLSTFRPCSKEPLYAS